jgi:Fur family iron response transcriptional regulator
MNQLPHLQKYTSADVRNLLSGHGINPTSQRVLVTRTLLERCTHLSAEELFRLIEQDPEHGGVSLATVYNTLSLLAEKGLVREVIVDPSRVFYDPNTAPHHHVYNVSTGELFDVDANRMRVTGLPPLPAGTDLDGIDVIVRVRSPS